MELKTIKYKLISVVFIIGIMSFKLTDAQNNSKRNTISLNGVWQVAEGTNDTVPENFNHTVPVPGLVSLATPQFVNAGPKVNDRNRMAQSDPLRAAFWYRRTFTISQKIPAIATLKIAKAMFGTRVYINGKDLGGHLPCFTPGYFNVKEALKEGVNEIMVRVGSGRDAVPLSVSNGFDFEKDRYIPGIYDNVQLILSETPHIITVQTAPDIVNKNLRVQLRVGNNGESKSANITFTIKEAKTRKTVEILEKEVWLSAAKDTMVDVKIPVRNCRFWSPEDPFLYNLEVNTESDEFSIRFGMREFHFDALTHKPVLNGKPYFMRGSNITLYRFFEDSASKGLPWNQTWVRNLHKSFKKFHWNSLRYCIGLPPEEWYRIADEEGFLIQDEFPVWYGGIGWNKWPEELKAGELVTEYTGWMQENWNHPSVVIWDASNETVSNNGQTDETGEAVWRVRNLDISNRPWDNSYSPHRAPGDVFEAHPYHFQNPDFKLKDIAKADSVPFGNQIKNDENFPVIINEYGWLWLSRDGSPTTLTKDLYKNLLGEKSTVLQRRHLYALYTAAETEFWRCHRKAAGVLHFTALGYSRSDGQTSDHFVNVEQLKYEDEFLKYIPDAFAPAALMIDEWGTEIECGKPHNFNILTINDLQKEWRGSVHLQILGNGKVIAEKAVPLTIPSYGQKKVSVFCNTPKRAGKYTVVASLERRDGASVKSTREIFFKE